MIANNERVEYYCKKKSEEMNHPTYYILEKFRREYKFPVRSDRIYCIPSNCKDREDCFAYHMLSYSEWDEGPKSEKEKRIISLPE